MVAVSEEGASLDRKVCMMCFPEETHVSRNPLISTGRGRGNGIRGHLSRPGSHCR